MFGCIPLPSLGQREQESKCKEDSLTGEKPHHAPVSGKDGQLHQVTEHAEDLKQELLKNGAQEVSEPRWAKAGAFASASHLQLLFAVEVVE